MTHGNRDYFNSMPLSTMYSMIDAAELAARLGSIVTFDRRGSVLWLTGFEEGIAEWEVTGRGDGYAAVISTDRAFSGGYSCKLIPGRTGTYEIDISRRHYLPPGGRVGFEFSILPAYDISYLYSRMYFYKGNKAYMCEIRYNNTDGTVSYRGANGSYVPFITNINIAPPLSYWSVFKWVYDMEEEEYVRCIVNNKEHNLKGIAPEIIDLPMPEFMHYSIGITQANDLQRATYVDNVILTINE